jgi:hypothetical protein
LQAIANRPLCLQIGAAAACASRKAHPLSISHGRSKPIYHDSPSGRQDFCSINGKMESEFYVINSEILQATKDISLRARKLSANSSADSPHHGHQVKEAALHRNIRNIGAPDLVGPLDRDAAQQVGIDLVAWRRAAQIWFRIKSFDSQNRMSRWIRLRLTSSVTAMRRLPKNGYSMYSSSSLRNRRRFSALSGRGWY